MMSGMVYLALLLALGLTTVSSTGGEMAFTNVTRFNLGGGDLFSIPGTDCGPTACMAASHGTALPAIGSENGCVCQCQKKNPAFREDLRFCVKEIDECQMATFGRGRNTTQIPYVILPMKGQIINPSKDIAFTHVEEAMCVVTSAQYLTTSGWVTLRDVVDNDVPFGLYRDEGKTFLQWRGSSALHARLEGRMVAAHVLCSAQSPPSLHSSCAVFRVAGTSRTSVLDVRSIPFHAGEIVSSELSSQIHGLSVLECLAIGVCVLMLIFVYAAGIVFYIHYKQRTNRKDKDPEEDRSKPGGPSGDNGSMIDTRMNLDGLHMKTNPLLGLDSLGNDYLHDAGLSDVSERTEETLDSSPNNTQKFQKVNSNEISAIVHPRRKKPIRPSIRTANSPELLQERIHRRSASPDTFERAPQSDLSIIDCSIEGAAAHHSLGSSNEEAVIRRKLYFNPVFFENEHLKNPPPAAVDFLIKIREVMSVAKEKMLSKRFIPILSDIPEEELYHTIDLGWDIPCVKRGRRFSAISLKRENSRRAVHCGGCPGCDSSSVKEKELKFALTRSNSCKSYCISEDYKQKIVRKWLDEVPSPPNTHTRIVKSIAKVSGTPRLTGNKKDEDEILMAPVAPLKIEETKSVSSTSSALSSVSKEVKEISKPSQKKKLEIKVIPNDIIDEKLKAVPIAVANNKEDSVVIVKNINHATRRVRKKLPPPPPPPVNTTESYKEEQEELIIPPEIQVKMKAVIKELNRYRRPKTSLPKEVKTDYVAPVAPKIIIPVAAADSQYYSDDNLLSQRDVKQKPFVKFDSLERSILKKRRFSVACGQEVNRNFQTEHQLTIDTKRNKLSQSWRDVRQAVDAFHLNPPLSSMNLETGNRSLTKSEIFINNTIEPLYGNIPNQKLGPLTIKVSGSPVESRRNVDEFDPDTLDRKPKQEAKKRVDKILLKSGGSFKFKSVINTSGEPNEFQESAFSRKIGSLRQIYEAKAKAQEEEIQYKKGIYERRSSITNAYDSDELTAFMMSMKTPDLLRQTEIQKPPIPPKQRRASVVTYSNVPRESPPRRLTEDKDRLIYNRQDYLIARRSGRRSNRTRSRRTDLKKLTKTEDSGYLSTDSNESKRRATYLMQMRSRSLGDPLQIMPSPITQMQRPLMTLLQIDTDTDDMESLCDGRSESGGESVETDSVFFGNFDESKKLLTDLTSFEPQIQHVHNDEQIDSGFMGETNIIVSGDSDSEHKSVISIVAGNDGRASSASITHLDDSLFKHSIEC